MTTQCFNTYRCTFSSVAQSSIILYLVSNPHARCLWSVWQQIVENEQLVAQMLLVTLFQHNLVFLSEEMDASKRIHPYVGYSSFIVSEVVRKSCTV